MKTGKTKNKQFKTDNISSFFCAEWKTLLLVSVSGILYNIGLLANPWFDGKLAGCLVNILEGKDKFKTMLRLASGYVVIILAVQGMRYLKRFYVRRFSNNVNRRMKKILYHNLLQKSKAELEQAGMGNLMTRAISDVDDCAEGMRKYTTEVFDTGVALAGYCAMMLCYDWRLAVLSFLFPPISYFLAEKMKTPVHRTSAKYKEQAGKLSEDTMDRASNALTYRIFGCEKQSRKRYEQSLRNYEKSAVKAGICTSALSPLYQVISLAGVVFILYFGSRNVLGQGWTNWNIASFTTFLTCYSKLAVKSSKAGKLFNSVHKAQVSWKRIKPFMAELPDAEPVPPAGPATLTVQDLSFAYPAGSTIFEDLSFQAFPGQIIGITGPVACGKSTLGKTFLCENPYSGSIQFGKSELSELTEAERYSIVGYLGHQPELMNDTIQNNVLMGDKKDETADLKAVCMDQEVNSMREGVHTVIGDGGIRLSGGQAQRLALARTLCHKKPLIILDDPFSALDRSTEKRIFENLKKLTKDSIVLLISHRLYLFPQMDQVIWMENGKTITGTHNTLMQKVPSYAELYREGGNPDET